MSDIMTRNINKRIPQKGEVYLGALGFEGGSRANIARAALDLFFLKGFMATTIRDIAKVCQLTPGALYNHYPSKDLILYEIVKISHEEADRALTEAITKAEENPNEQLFELVRTFVRFHCHHRREALVGNQNFRFLQEPYLNEIRASRIRIRRIFEDVLIRGHRDKNFWLPVVKGKPSPRIMAIAIGNMCITVAEWFVPNGPLTDEEVSKIYGTLALNLVKKIKMDK
jgi:AcrR family transcriptional regulator